MFNAVRAALLLALALVSGGAHGQATARPCGVEEQVGPACLMVRQDMPTLPMGPLYWHLDTFGSVAAAERAAAPPRSGPGSGRAAADPDRAAAHGAVVTAFGTVWLFTIARKAWRSTGGTHVAAIGPLPIEPAASYAAEYLRSIFDPGTVAPLHVHSGPEAFYAVSGDTCLETPDGIMLGRGPGNALVIRGGPPMLLMAIGPDQRRGFALILHDAARPPTTLIHDWQPKGECAQQRHAR